VTLPPLQALRPIRIVQVRIEASRSDLSRRTIGCRSCPSTFVGRHHWTSPREQSPAGVGIASRNTAARHERNSPHLAESRILCSGRRQPLPKPASRKTPTYFDKCRRENRSAHSLAPCGIPVDPFREIRRLSQLVQAPPIFRPDSGSDSRRDRFI